MKILVLVKETFDTEANIVLRDNKNIDDRGIRYIINPYDVFAIEEALLLKEKFGGEVVIISLGRAESENTICNALALGADRGKLIISKHKDGLTVSRLLAESIIHEGDYDLILSGWIAIDDNKAQIPGRISELLGIPLVNVVTKIDIFDKQAICEREGERFLERIEVPLPAMIAIQSGINEPRFPTVQNMIQASKILLEKVTVDNCYPQIEDFSNYELPFRKRKGVIMKVTNPNDAVSFLLKNLIDEKLI